MSKFSGKFVKILDVCCKSIMSCNFCNAGNCRHKCSRRKEVSYCGREHQSDDWTLKHKYECATFKRLVEVAPESNLDVIVDVMLAALRRFPDWYLVPLLVKLQRVTYGQMADHASSVSQMEERTQQLRLNQISSFQTLKGLKLYELNLVLLVCSSLMRSYIKLLFLSTKQRSTIS